MDTQDPPSPRQRLQELLAIPERQRTDQEWDELNELEIALASANREGAPEPAGRRIGGDPPPKRMQQPGQPRGDGKNNNRKQGRNNRPQNRKGGKRNAPPKPQ